MKRLDFLVDVNCYPQTIDVLKTRAKPHGINVVIGNPWEDIKTNDKIYALLVQYPNIRGEILDLKDLIKRANEKNILVVVACDLLSLTLLTPPGEIGADIVLGNSQRFGVPLCFGGPHAAFFATKDDYKRLDTKDVGESHHPGILLKDNTQYDKYLSTFKNKNNTTTDFETYKKVKQKCKRGQKGVIPTKLQARYRQGLGVFPVERLFQELLVRAGD